MLDTTFNGLIGFSLFGFAFYAIAPYTANSFFSYFESGAGRIIDIILTTFTAAIIGGALVGVTGFTLGKLIFEVKVTRLDGSKLGLVAGLSRDFIIFVKGLGFGVPIVAMITMWFSYKGLTDSGATSWDKGSYIVWHRPSGTAQYILNVIGVILIFLTFGGCESRMAVMSAAWFVEFRQRLPWLLHVD